ncbi:MAG: coniferyl-aldehyde dehydrogenase, partial [Moraxellaceae bacterium]|nr:coniferyl-aldehyde dehydrogenase [Moraxellaceae bacterium]
MVANVVEMSAGSVQVADLHRVFQTQKQAFRQRPMPTASERLANLEALRRALIKYQDELAQAVSDDFGHRSLDETKIAEILTSIEGIKYYSKNVRKWMRPEKR